MKFGRATLRLQKTIPSSGVLWIEDENRAAVAASKLEPLLQGSVDLVKTPVNPSPSSSLGKKLAVHF